MINLLVKYFIKDAGNVKDPYVRAAYANLGSIIGIVTNTLLCLCKIGVGIFFNSMSVLADGINNLSDAGSSVVTLIGFKLSIKPADDDHPFGHARIEYIAGLIVSFLILILGIDLIRSSISKIINPEPVESSSIIFIILILSILIKLWLSKFNFILGKKIDSTTMIATSVDSRNDVIATTAVLIALIINDFTTINLDGIMGVVVGIFIFISGINLVKETTNPLLGEAPDPEFVKCIESKILACEVVSGLHDLVIHSYGVNKWFASVHVEVPAEIDFLECHDILDNIERDLKNELDIHLVVHLDPIVTNDPKTNDIKEKVENIIAYVDNRLSMHDFRIACHPTYTNIIFDVVVPVGFKETPEQLASLLGDKIKEIDSTYHSIITVDTNYISTSISCK